MRRTLLTFIAIIFMSMVSFNANAQDDSQTYLRGGISDMTGFVAVEHIAGHGGFYMGWHQFSGTSVSESKSSFDIGLNWYTNTVHEDSWYLGCGYATTNAVRSRDGVPVKWDGTFNVVGGYRFGNENFDVKLGGGYLFSSIKNGPAIDLSVGIGF